MKKNMEKILATASIIVALVLIMILLVTVFGGIEFSEFDNKVVRGLMVTLGVVYFILAAASLTLIFTSSDIAKEIVIRSKQEGSVRASVGVVRKLVKSTCADIDGVQCRKINIYTNDFGVHLKVNIKITDKNVEETEAYVRTAIEEQFIGALGFKFNSIEIKVTELKPKYVLDKAEVARKSEQRLSEMKKENAAVDSDKEEAEAVEQEKAQDIAADEAVGEEPAAEVIVEDEKPAQINYDATEETEEAEITNEADGDSALEEK